VNGAYANLTAADGHVFAVYESRPQQPPRGGVIVLQEVFGVNRHIRAVADAYAAAGYHVMAPALYDRVARDAAFEYTDEGRDAGRRIVERVTWDDAIRDIDATRAALARSGRVGLVGYCYGGIAGWRAVTHLDGLAAASCYYASRIGEYAHEVPRAPVQFHFAERDHSVSAADIETVRNAQANRDVAMWVYPAAHGFNCDLRPTIYDPAASALARERTLAFFARYVG
jgi:carboxymethylenebutenolidase